MKLLLLLAFLATLANSFTIHQPNRMIMGNADSVTSIFSTAQPAEPEVQTKTRNKPAVKKETKKTEKRKKTLLETPVQNKSPVSEDAPMYSLFLIGDSTYDISFVCGRLFQILKMDADQASTVFKLAQSAGKASCGKFPLERAELYKEQLLRSSPMIFSDIEEDK